MTEPEMDRLDCLLCRDWSWLALVLGVGWGERDSWICRGLILLGDLQVREFAVLCAARRRWWPRESRD